METMNIRTLYELFTNKSEKYFGSLAQVRADLIAAGLTEESAEARAVRMGFEELRTAMADLNEIADALMKIVGPFAQEPPGGKGKA